MTIDLNNPNVHVYVYDDLIVIDITIVDHDTQEQVTIKNVQTKLLKQILNETESVQFHQTN